MGDALGPLDETDASLVEVVAQSEPLRLRTRSDPEDVDMDHRAPGCGVLIDDREGRARHMRAHPESFARPLDELRLPGSKVAGKTNNSARFQGRGKRPAQGECLVRGR